jgi:NAD(P)-dependent dehydrogenase (short-subunit alcohol dehydrogenase family)
MPTLLITGANRGLGFGLTELYVADGWRIFACVRAPQKAAALSALAAKADGRLTLHPLDVEDHASVEALGRALRGQPIDVLLNVAGWYGSRINSEPGGLGKFGESDFAEWERIYRINVIGPMKMAETFVDNVAASQQKKLVSLTSIIGSIGGNPSGMMYGYRASKAALNAVMKAMAIDLKARGIIAVPLHPGWVRTEMGGPNADIDTPESVHGMKKVIDGLTPADSGRFLAYDGSELPW